MRLFSHSTQASILNHCTLLGGRTLLCLTYSEDGLLMDKCICYSCHILASSRKTDWKQTKQRQLKIYIQLLFSNLLFSVMCVNTYMPNQLCGGPRNSVELVLSFHLIKLSQCSEFFFVCKVLIDMVSSQEEMLFFS